MGMIRLWAHECNRVWGDRLIDDKDTAQYMVFMTNALKEFADVKAEEVFEEPCIYTSFVAACEGHEAA